MRTLFLILSVFILLAAPHHLFAQDNAQVKTLINQGTALNDSGKYAEAIDKYKEALKIDPENVSAQYEMAYTLSSWGKGSEAIPILEKIAPLNTMPEAYDLLASTYDDAKDFAKSEAYYRQGIIAFPTYQRLYFNLGISYQRQNKYPEAETEAIEAIKLNQKHASSQRLYALAAYYQNKRGPSLLAWCNFLMLEPQSKRSAEAYAFISKILRYGLKWTGEKAVTITISPNDLSGGNLLMPMAILNATENKDKKILTAVDSLTLQLTEVFKISGELEDAKKRTAFFTNFYAHFFEKLAASDHMPTFARVVSLAAYREENIAWFKQNDQKLKDLNAWLAATERKF